MLVNQAGFDVEIGPPDGADFAHGIVLVQRKQVGAHLREAEALADFDALAVPGPDDFQRQRLAAHDEVAQATQVGGGEGRAFHHHFEHSGHAHEDVGPLLVEQRENALGLEFLEQPHRGPPVQKRREQHVPAPSVEGRHTVNRDVDGRDFEAQAGVEAVPEQHPVRVEGTLREAGGAGSVENEHGVVLVGLGTSPGGRGRGQAALAQVGQGLQGPHARHRGQAGQREGFVLKLLFVDEERGLAIAHQVVDFAAGQPVVDGHEDEAGFLGGHE